MFTPKCLIGGLLVFLAVACTQSPAEPVVESQEISEVAVEEPTVPARAEPTDLDSLFEAHRWSDRVLLVFAPTSDSPQLEEQLERLSTMQAGLTERDLVVWQLVNENETAIRDGTDSDSPPAAFYERFSVEDDVFTVILLGKDGTEKLRQTEPVMIEDLFALIDAMPMRQREMLQQGQ